MWTDKVIDSFDVQDELSPGAFALSDAVVANNSIVFGSGPIDVTTPPGQWAFAVTFPLRRTDLPSHDIHGPLLIKIDAAIESGRIGIGCVASDLQSYVTPEIERTSEDGKTVFDVIVETVADGCSWLVIRNVSETNIPSRVTVQTIRTFKLKKTRIPDLIEVESPVIPNILCAHSASFEAEHKSEHSCSDTPNPCLEPKTGRFQILLTHTSRSWDWSKCKRDYLIERYADPGRLRNLPPFEDLRPPPTYLYSGGVTILQLEIKAKEAQLTALR